MLIIARTHEENCKSERDNFGEERSTSTTLSCRPREVSCDAQPRPTVSSSRSLSLMLSTFPRPPYLPLPFPPRYDWMPVDQRKSPPIPAITPDVCDAGRSRGRRSSWTKDRGRDRSRCDYCYQLLAEKPPCVRLNFCLETTPHCPEGFRPHRLSSIGGDARGGGTRRQSIIYFRPRNPPFRAPPPLLDDRPNLFRVPLAESLPHRRLGTPRVCKRPTVPNARTNPARVPTRVR